VLNSYGRFGPPAFAPVLLNIVLILAAVVASRWFAEPTYALAWGVLLAGIMQWLFQMPFLAKLHLLPRPRWDTRHEGVRRTLKLMVPALFGVSVSQINLLLDTVLASFLPSGSVSWLYYSDRLSELPLGVFAIAIATVILPSLSRDRATAQGQAFSNTLDWALKLVLLIGLPAAVALIVLGRSILTALFQYRETSAFDVMMSSFALAAIATGLTAFMLIKVLAPGFYARQDLKTPVRIGIYAMVANMVFNLILVVPLHHYFKLGHVGLALATSLAAWLNAGLLWRGLARDGIYRASADFRHFLGKLLLAALAMGAALWWADPAPAQWQGWAWWQRLGVLALLCGGGFGLYIGLLTAAGVRWRTLRSPMSSPAL
jgi:putative peptidoglycan lipid II flippase